MTGPSSGAQGQAGGPTTPNGGRLTIYGSLTCPYSLLASLRADRLVERGLAVVEWRAVVHDPEVPPSGVPVSGELAELLDQELMEIRSLVEDGEHFAARRPAVQPGTAPAVAAYARAGDDGPRLRRALFDAFWVDGLDLGDHRVLADLGCPAPAPSPVAGEWRSAWLALDRPLVPMAVLPGDTVSRGLGLLQRLAHFGDDRTSG